MAHFIVQYLKKSTFVNNAADLIRKVFKYWVAFQAHDRGYVFSKVLIFVFNSKFVIGNKYSQLFSMKWWAHLLHFWENVCQIPGSVELCILLTWLRFDSPYQATSSNTFLGLQGLWLPLLGNWTPSCVDTFLICLGF